MIRFFVVALIFITIYSIYYDLSSGTIPETVSSNTTVSPLQADTSGNEESSETSKPYIEVEIKAGDTVLTVAEKMTNKPIPVSIQQLIEDFQILNNGTAPEKIQIGKTYKFPVY
ncbi:hypothetical protein FIU87_14465 [Bacillus sp. THAF10]|uniref:hypothetical protein n=1 Tax=Bacillus sp. THAF10 TaxID=2587848 RepID=UPI001267D2EE|nr:hypothetical protein [Bacillus sp. THAF10]QFT89864.1 hypothetical protein FIU87_14465 [Bacillus sp. THAF10]